MAFMEILLIAILLSLIILTYILIFIKYLTKRRKNTQKKIVSTYKCLDGDIVKSRGELIIDNLLTELWIEHIYEKIIYIKGNKIKCDWFLPNFEIYIEYWGLEGDKNYLDRKNEKIKLYNKANLKLISVENADFNDIYKNFKEKFKKYDVDLDPYISNRHCPNCGAELDSRFLGYTR
jgi:hypothetical protein